MNPDFLAIVQDHAQRRPAMEAQDFGKLASDMAGFSPALRELELLSRTGKPAIAAVDGRCGSGKTRFAALACSLLPCQVVHMDDFYLPPDCRALDWEATPAGNMDLKRFRQEVLLPALEGKLRSCRPYDCQTGQMGEAVELSGCPLTLVEGSYAHHPALAPAYRFTIFLTCDPQEQIRRLKRREGERYPAFETRWRPMEERYFQAVEIEKKASMVLDTTGFFR